MEEDEGRVRSLRRSRSRDTEAVDVFFGGTAPDDSGVTIDLDDDLDDACLQEYSEPGRQGYTIDVQALQKRYPNLTHLRFYNSY